jgi:inner membrane protein
MDNICHTLVGAALAEAGLRKKTPLATGTLLVAANLPDVDGVLYWVSQADTAYGFRRGWTHGVLALALWPFVLTGLVLAWDRWVRRRRHPAAEPALPLALLGLSALALLTHLALDYLNTYGVRWLMPFQDAWSYGDTLFIADPWVWLALGLGYYLSSRRRRRGAPHPERAAAWSLALVTLYIAVMGVSGLAARAVARAAIERSGVTVVRLMAGPFPATPFRRQIVAEAGDRYILGTVDWLHRPLFVPGAVSPVLKRDQQPAVAEAARTPSGVSFMRWARFPFYVVERGARATVVRMVDARYTLDPEASFGALSVTLPQAIPSSGVSANQEQDP